MTARPSNLLTHLRRLSARANTDADAELLARFVSQHDESAFASLLARHGPMVWNACRRLLGRPQDAEDAFQATFLVLARRAGFVRRPERLAGWLYGVAHRVARVARRRSRQQSGPGLAGPVDPPAASRDPLAELTARDLLVALEEEVERLPEAYRLAVVLCCLEGLSQEEAAARLGCTPGSLKGRLERGRKQLRTRLARRGLTLSAALGVVEGARGAGALPAALAGSTAQIAVAAAGNMAGGAVPAAVAALTKGVLHMMFFVKLKTAAVVLAVLALVGGGGLLAYSTRAAPAPREERPRPAPKEEGRLAEAAQAKIRQLQLERIDVLKKAVAGRWDAFWAGAGLENLLQLSGQLQDAELEQATTPRQRIAARAAHLKRAKELEEIMAARVEAGRVSQVEYHIIRAVRLKAEIEWRKAGGKD